MSPTVNSNKIKVDNVILTDRSSSCLKKKMYFEAPLHHCHAVKEPNPVITKTLR